MIDMIIIPGIDQNMIANNLTSFEPLHPGEVLREELAERGVTQTQLAKRMGVSVSLLNEVINGKRGISTEYALLLEAALGIDADFWLNMQRAYDKDATKSNKAFLKRLAAIRKVAAVF